MNELNGILQNLLALEEGMDCGTIAFTCDNLASAMKWGHPVEIFDSIIADVVWDMDAGNIPSREKLEELLKGLKRFKRNFKVKELSAPISALGSYITSLDVPKT